MGIFALALTFGRLTVAALPDELGSSPPVTVLEPGSWFTMILGLGVMSIVLRRRSATRGLRTTADAR
jgi:hypothetical protein